MPAKKKAVPSKSSSKSTEKSTSTFVEKNKERIRKWAKKGILFGTSSWKYDGWKGQVYNRAYKTKKEFEQTCLTEYSELFPTVSGDFALYAFPKPEYMRQMHDTTTDDFKVSLKVTERITILQYPNLPRYGANAGKGNPDFLNVELFEDAFLKSFDELKKKKGAIIFEFSTFYPSTGMTYDGFVERLDDFLGKLPKGYRYSVEIRNKDFLRPEYLKMLKSHKAAHVLNSWTRMPPIIEQMNVPGILTAPFLVTRALVVPGTTYANSVDAFEPYDKIKEKNPELRTGLVHSVRQCVEEGKEYFAYINNRAEGNGPKTIEGVLDLLDSHPKRLA